jgi:flavorubredoxin
VGRILPLAKLRWIMFGHVESDECGAMNEFLAAAPEAQVAHGRIGCMTSLNDLCDRPPRVMQDGEVIDLGGKRVRFIDTPHVPHNWEACVLFEETTRTLLCGDLFTHVGDGPALTKDDIVPAALETEKMFQSTALSGTTAPTIRKLAELEPARLAPMHGSSFEGDCSDALIRLATAFDEQLTALQRA